jgi:PhnB protein
MSFSPYLTFNGTCREAMTWYAGIFGAKDLQVMSYTDAPPGTPGMDPSMKDQVMHSQFTLGGGPLMGSDAPAAWYQPQAGVSVMHGAGTRDRAEQVFKALAEGGEVTMPFGDTFWAEGFGMVRDRFGTHWMISGPPKAMD